MLNLTRRRGEVIIITLPEERGGGVIEIVTKEVFKGQVKLGINAPRDLPIYRLELLENPPDSIQ